MSVEISDAQRASISTLDLKIYTYTSITFLILTTMYYIKQRLCFSTANAVRDI